MKKSFFLKASLPAMIVILVLLYFKVFLPSYNDYQWNSRAYIIDCTVYDTKLNVLKDVPGSLCVFLPSGNVIRFLSESYFDQKGKNEVEMIDGNNQVLWHIPLALHHTMKADRKGERVYAFSSEIKMHEGMKTKFDVLVSIDLSNGKILHKWSLSDIQAELEKEMGNPLPAAESLPYGEKGEATLEVSHFNSINLVPENFSKDYEIVVNTGRGLVLFFDRDLHLKGRFWFDQQWRATTHDVQLKDDGTLLVYKNSGQDRPKSSLEIVSMEDHKILWSYSKTPDGKEFQSTRYGSVQFFPDSSFLFTDMDEGGRFTTIDSDGAMINSHFHPQMDPRTKKAKEYHTIRRLEFEDLPPDVQKLLDEDRQKIFLSSFFEILR